MTQLEVCIDSLESAWNAIKGGASELEVCSSLLEGGLTPSPGLVIEVLNIVNKAKNDPKTNSEEGNQPESQQSIHRPKINIMIRCRGGSDFCYSSNDINTMIADIKHYKAMDIDSFVFGALTDRQEIDEETCTRIISEANPIPVTFHRAFDLCSNPYVGIERLIKLGFKRLLTSGQRQSAADGNAIELIKNLNDNFGGDIEIMPGAGVSISNVKKFIDIGCKIVHSSCKVEKKTVDVIDDLGMSCKMYVTSENIVRDMIRRLNNV